MCNFSLFLHIFLPALTAIPAFAEEPIPTPTPTPIVESTPAPTAEPTIAVTSTAEPTAIPTPEPTAIPTEEPVVTPEPIVTPIVIEERTATPEVTITPTSVPSDNNNNNQSSDDNSNSATPVPDSSPVVPTPSFMVPSPTPSPRIVEQICSIDGDTMRDSVELDWNYDASNDIYVTREKIQLGVKYIFPKENNVTVTFTSLPKDELYRSYLKIKQVKSSDLKLPENMGNVGEYAYDITTDMFDGEFKYDITFPKNSNQTAEISYIEKSIDDVKNNEIKIDEIKPIEESKTEQSGDTVKALNVDHFTIFFVTDQTPTAPLSSPSSSAQPRYISGFGSDNTYTIFYEDRNDAVGCTADIFRIYFMTTTNGPAGLSAPVKTDICDTHFTVKDWPITISGDTYAYRAWGSGINKGSHNFYVSNNQVNWTLITTFIFDPPSDGIIYGFHDIVQLNGHYIGWVESADSHTYIVRSDNGDEHWTVIAKVGGSGPTDLPLNLDLAPGIYGPKPSGNFVLIELDGQLTYAKLYLAGDYSGAYMAINQAAAQATTPALKEDAFIDPDNWTWRDGTTGKPGLANTVIASTKASGGHDVREGWTVPTSDYHSDYVFLYTADYTTGAAKGLGYLVATQPSVVWVDDNYNATNCAADGHTWEADCFDNIQEGIDAVVPGGTVNVAAGTYAEHLSINKAISIVGADKSTTIIDGSSTGVVALITVDDVTLSGFTIKNSGINPQTDAGIGLNAADNCAINGNIVTNNVTGIAVMSSTGNTINSNTISNNSMYGIVLEAGVSGVYSTGNIISENIINANGRDGIYAGQDNNSNQILNNEITGTIGDTNFGSLEGNGIYLWKSAVNTITGNTISGNNRYGIEMFGSKNNTITSNELTGNLDGMHIRNINETDYPGYSIKGNNISNNKIYSNTRVNLYASPNVDFNIENNWWGSADGETIVNGLASWTSDGSITPGTTVFLDYTPWCINFECAIFSSANAITVAATGITSTDATLNGTNGSYDATGTSFWVSTSIFSTDSSAVPVGVYNTPSSGVISANTPFSVPLSSTGIPVTPGTTYYFAAWSEVGGTWYPGEVKSFTTSAPPDTTAPDVPLLVSPADGVYIKSTGLTLDWSDSTDPSSPVTYYYQSSYSSAVGAKKSLISPIYNVSTGTVSEINASGSGDNLYYWQVKACDALNNCSDWSGPWAINIDNIAPTATISYNTTNSTNQSVTATLTPNEPITVTSTGGLTHTFSINGSFTFEFKDDAGNTGSALAKVENIDKTNPITNYSIAGGTTGDNGWYKGSVTPTITLSTEANATIYWRWESEVWISGVSQQHPIVTNGVRTLEYYSVDLANNEETSHLFRTVKYDSTLPAVPLNPASPENWNTHYPTLSWDAVNDVDLESYSFQICRVNPGSGACTSQERITNNVLTNSRTLTTSLADGGYWWRVRSHDDAGNNSTWSGARKITIDTIAPVLISQTNDFSGWYNSNQTSYFNYSDSGSGIASGNPASCVISTEGTNQTCSITPNVCDAAGNCNTTTITSNGADIDKTVPAIPTAIYTSINGSNVLLNNITYTNSKNFKFNLASDSDTTRYQLKYWNGIDGSVYKINKPWNSTNLSAIYTDNFTQGEGTHYFIFSACDAAGNCSDYSNPFTIVYDKTAPSLFSQTSFSNWYKTSVTSTFNYTDSNGVVSENNPTCDITTQGENKTCTVTPNVCDAAGNCNITTVTSNPANLDFTDPESRITSPQNLRSDSTIYLNIWNGFISGTASDLTSGVKEVQLTVQKTDGQYWTGSVWQIGETPVVTVGTTNWTYQIGATLADGTYTIKSHAIDNAGNTENTYTLTIILDKTINEVSISLDPAVGDASNGWYKTQPTITLTGTDTNFDKIQYQWDSQTGTWTTYSVPFKLLSEGAHVLYYQAVDLANNTSTVGVKNIAWDQTDLEYGPQNISANPNPTSGSTSKIKWEFAKDNSGIDKYEVQWSLSGLNYSKTVGAGTTEVEIDQLTEGSWTVKVVAFDGSGRSKDNSINVVVDRSGPIAPVLTLAGTGVGTATLSWNAITDANDYIVWYGNAPGSRLYGARVGNVTSYTVRSLGAGNYYFIVKAVDAAQNQGAESNEVSTGTITGAANVEPGTPAEGFTEEVLGTTTTEVTTPTSTLNPSLSDVLGISANNINYLWWLLLILPFSLVLWLILKKKRN